MGAQEQISDRYAFHLLECDHTAGAVSPAAPGGLPSSRPGVWIAERARYKEAGAWRPRLRKASERYLTPLDRVRSILRCQMISVTSPRSRRRVSTARIS